MTVGGRRRWHSREVEGGEGARMEKRTEKEWTKLMVVKTRYYLVDREEETDKEPRW